MKKIKKISMTLIICIVFFGCKSDESIAPPTDTFGTMTLQFTNSIESETLELNTGTYANSSNESYSVNELKYILSDIILIDDQANEFIYPKAESYFLINEENATSKIIALQNIPSKNYTTIKFGFGVDQSNYPLNEVANFIPTAEEQGMLWSWSAGYKFIKFEGVFTPQGGTETPFLYHVGSHGTALDNYKTITLSLPQNAIVANEGNTEIVINADIAKIFDSTNTMSLQTNNDVQVDPVNAPLIATNIATMFSVAQVNN